MADCVTEHGHEPLDMDPRHQLRRQVERCQARGYDPVLATEIEFYLTDETGKPVYDGIQCYSLQKGAELEHVVGDIRRMIEEYGIVVEASNTEYGPAQIEINLGHGPAVGGRRRHGRVQVGRARDRAPARPARDVHGQAVPGRLGQRPAPAPQPA